MKKTNKNKAKIKNITVSKSSDKSLNKTGLIPLGNRVLIKPYTKEELQTKNSFGIILPNSGNKEKSEQGLVLAVGPGEYKEGNLVPVSVKVGDRVVFSRYGYEDITLDGQDYYLIKDDSILAVIKQ